MNETMYIEKKNIFLMLFMPVIAAAIWVVMALLLQEFGLFIGAFVMLAAYIYPIIKWCQMVNEINIMCEGDGDHLVHYLLACLFSIISCGIYGLYYLYKMQTRLHENAGRYGVAISQSGGSILLWGLLLAILFGIGPIIAAAIIISSFNKLAYGYNQTMGLEAGSVIENNESGWDNGDTGYNQIVEELPAPASVICIAGVAGEKMLNLPIPVNHDETLTIGRDPKEANIVVADPKVSRKHCAVKYDAQRGQMIVTDYSSNGTTLGDGKKLEKGVPTPVDFGSVLVVSAETKFTLQK